MNRLFLVLLLLVGALIIVIFWTSTESSKKENIEMTILPMTFAHVDHVEEQCVACHHNYQDNTGHGLCIICHQTDEKISFLMEEQFHCLCMGCHTEKQHKNENFGPMRHCARCHTQERTPRP